MKIALLNPPFRLPGDSSRWITVPPQRYGGIQWVVATLIDGLLAAGCELALLGAPGSPARSGLTVPDVVDATDTELWLANNRVDVVHDHTNGDLRPARTTPPTISTFHLTGTPQYRTNCVYVSEAQRTGAGSATAPVIRLPVNPERHLYTDQKQDFLLFLGRVSRHKGAKEAAAFAAAAGLPLRVAGPSWEPEYLTEITTQYPGTVEYLGDVGGRTRLELISGARAILVMSQPVRGSFGDVWSEPGATVVSEAAVSGTPVISTANGCLPEIVPDVGLVLPDSADGITAEAAEKALAALPQPDEVRAAALQRWGHHRVTREYLAVYERLLRGDVWL
ncbi:glycosyltransferase [Micromonospora sp. NPDC050980]|uniref:glycosyltransferase n=1 Tax=Micromonospora sp. NPDC050980 TaxID=3155161 RepID=UPI0033FF7ADA